MTQYRIRRHVLVRRIGGAVTVALLLGMSAACSGSSTTSSASTSTPKSATGASGPVVSLKLLQFVPATLTVKVGTTVTWRSDEDITHTVTSGTYTGTSGPSGLRTSQQPNGLFNARLPKKGSTTTYRFTKAGTYPYYCNIHEGMNAKVVVTP